MQKTNNWLCRTLLVKYTHTIYQMRMRKSFHKVYWTLAVQIITLSTFGLSLGGAYALVIVHGGHTFCGTFDID